MRNAKGLWTFAAGAALGSLTTWYFVKEKYARLAQEEIDSVKEVFSERGRIERVEKATEKIEKDQDERAAKEMSVREYAAKLSEERYSTDYADIQPAEEDPEDDKPYVITPDEFSEIDEYETISLTFYSDHILADDGDELIEDIDAIVGVESLNHFGEYEDDSVFVRNDRLKCDYEILLDNRKYSDVIKQKPYLRRYDDEDQDE